MFLIGIAKRCIVFVIWKMKTPPEELESKKNQSCDSVKYIFSSRDKNSIMTVSFFITVAILRKSAELT